MEKAQVLRQVFGYESFRPGQEELIAEIMAGRDVLGIMPTGAGKSLCYQVPALMLPGITLVVSPLISLMKDQVNALTQSGVAAAYINSSLTAKQYNQALDNAASGAYKIIYVAPERLSAPDFLAFAKTADIDMVTIDEAHCVSQWGQDFRPGYLDIPTFIEGLDERPIVSAFTATATHCVREDIQKLLRLQSPHTLVTGFDRDNLYFEVRTPKDKDRELLSFLKQNEEKSGIVYCATRKAVEEVCELLNGSGFMATRYHAGLGDGERQRNQEDFLYDRQAIMVATNAFGMGIDKSNVGFVVHYNMPKNLESYYQEAGRAGRDGEPAHCLLLYAPKDVRINQFLINHSRDGGDALSPEERELVRQNDLELLKRMTWFCTTTECLRRYILQYFGENSPIYCGHCGNCNTHYETADITVEAQKILSCVVRVERLGRPYGKTMIANILHGTDTLRVTQGGLDKLPTYGIMAETPVRRIVHMIDYLASQGWLELTADDYPVLRANARSAAVLRGEEAISMKLPKGERKTAKRKAAREKAENEPLFEVLKALRTKFAKTAGVPAYTVFTDASLRDMCARLPRTEAEFLEVSGVGNAKLQRYGHEFLAAIGEFSAEG